MEIHTSLKQLDINTKDIVILSLSAAIMIAGKQVLAGLPNIEVVSFLFIIYTLVFGWKKTMLIATVFIINEGFIWGFGLWFWGYVYMWPLLIIATELLKRRVQSEVGWSIVSGIYGLSFGLLYAIYIAPLMGVGVREYWLSGIPFDIAHMIGNFFFMMILYYPVRNLLERLYKEAML